MPLSALCAKSRDDEMVSFERTFPHLQARSRQRRFNLDNGLAEDDGGGGVDAEGRANRSAARGGYDARSGGGTSTPQITTLRTKTLNHKT